MPPTPVGLPILAVTAVADAVWVDAGGGLPSLLVALATMRSRVPAVDALIRAAEPVGNKTAVVLTDPSDAMARRSTCRGAAVRTDPPVRTRFASLPCRADVGSLHYAVDDLVLDRVSVAFVRFKLLGDLDARCLPCRPVS